MREYNKLTDEQKIQAVKLYNSNKSYKYIGDLFGVTGESISRLLKKRGVKSRGNKKYVINESFFEEIDTSDKAYFLGFLYADGYIDEKRGQVELTLQSKDKEILEKLSKAISSDKPLTYKKAKKHWKTGNMESDSYRLYIKNRKMSQDLIKLGMRQNKSFTLEWPNCVPDNLIWHFIRGYFDGDGCIYYKTEKGNGTAVSSNIISSPSFISELSKFLIKEGFSLGRHLHKASKPMETLYINGGIQGIFNFYKKIYENTTLYMERKYNTFLECFRLRKFKYEN